MTTLQQIILGNPPDGSGGDTVRGANAKVNGNTSILDACVPLGYQILGASKTLALGDVGTRIGLFFQQAGGTMVMPLANTVRQNGVIHFFNIGFAVTVGFQGNDNAAITRINAGDFVTYVSDGASYWHVAARGKVGADEAVVGSLSVGGALTAGAMTASGLLTAAAGMKVIGQLSVNRDGGEGDLLLGGNDGYYYGTASSAGWYSPTNGSFYYTFSNQTFTVPNLSVAGAAAVGSLKISGNTAWDAGNFNPANYVPASAVAALKASGGNEGDLNPSAYEVRLSLAFAATGPSVMANASLYINIGAIGADLDVLAYVDLYDATASVVIATGVVCALSAPSTAKAGMRSFGALACGISANGLTVGRAYQIRLQVCKTVATGPIYPRGMQIQAMVV
ncbi:hypothetical protein [Burkholderia gladioli]|uniref:hypothetical protein n=1 Tax=Burkholderia gladioli TaxID=28095 RepID=UPI001641CC56|nr:hypothetical protein [Burkholderia gladioli]